jgi:hypothetical protein
MRIDEGYDGPVEMITGARLLPVSVRLAGISTRSAAPTAGTGGWPLTRT